ncbi:MAG: YggT family protein [Actinobacteria bacterium]|nr:YggT family protein [Actinomycetota bacterium]
MEEASNRSQVESPAFDGNIAKTEVKAPAGINSSIRISLIVDYIFWVVAAVILLRFAFKLIGANSQNAFVTLVYNFTNPVVSLFKGIVSDVTSGNMVIEVSSLITIVILWLIYKAVLRLITIMK